MRIVVYLQGLRTLNTSLRVICDALVLLSNHTPTVRLCFSANGVQQALIRDLDLSVQYYLHRQRISYSLAALGAGMVQLEID
jgi:hypothetical protein